jgi:hypothetical protein
MRKVFAPQAFSAVPDGTLVSPFLNPFDNTGGMAGMLAGGQLGLAAGRLEPGVASRIHVLPLVTQITWVVRGRLRVVMQSPADPEPYALRLDAGQAACTEPGELLQLVNDDDARTVEVLYITSPAYVYEVDGHGAVVYDDARVVAASWEDTGDDSGVPPGELPTLRRARDAAISRLEAAATRGS